jgi:MFS family permease
MPVDHGGRDDLNPQLLGLGLSAMLVPLGSTMIAVALPGIGTEFHRTPSELTQWLVNSYLVVNIVALIPGGRLGDRWGYSRALRMGQCLFAAGCLLPILFPSFETLVASRVLQALGGALMVPTVMAVFRIAVPPARIHRVLGYFGAMMSFAAGVGPSLGGFLVERFGWSSIFLVNLPPLLLSVYFSVGFFRSHPHEKAAATRAVDWLGSMRALFADEWFATGFAMVGLLNLAMYSLLFELPFLLKLVFQWGPGHSGQFLTAFMLSMMAGSAVGGRLSEALGARKACFAGSLISAVGFGSLVLLSTETSALQLMAGLALGGLGVGLANGPSNASAFSTIDRAMSGTAAGVLAMGRYLGGIFGITLVGILFAGPGAAQSLSRHHYAVLALATSLVVAALVALLLPGRVKPE